MYGNIYGQPSPYGTYNPVQTQLPRKTIDRVNGKNGAEMYQLAPESSVILLDENDPMIWFIQTDSAGYKTVKPYDIKPHEEEKLPDVKSFDERLNGFDERLRVIEEALK